jgi:hypothetical protein
MNIFNQTKLFIDKLPKRLTDKKKASEIKNYILNIECIDKYGNVKPCKDATKSVLITKTKHYIRDNNIFKDMKNLDDLNAPEIYNKIFQTSNEKRANKKPVDVDIADVDKIFNLRNAKKIMNYKGVYEIDFYAIYCYLLATSGMRTNELWDNSFVIVDKQIIKPVRLSKTFNKDAPDDAVVNLIVDAKDWLCLFDELQNYIKTHKPNYGSSVFSGIKRKLEKINKNLSGHSLRKLYVAYHKQILNTDTDKLPSVSTARLLNHNGENASTYYTGAVNITGELKDVIDRTDYSKYTIAKLKDLLKSKNVSFTSKMKKDELLKLLNC